MTLRVQPFDFERMFHLAPASLPGWIVKELEKTDSAFHFADPEERAEYFQYFEEVISSPRIQRSREESLTAFERGWTENYEKILRDGISLENLKPGYFRGNKFLRYARSLIVSENHQLEFDLFRIARMVLFEKYEKYLRESCSLWELGCGSGENLLMLSEQFPEADIHGTDWTFASGTIANYLGKTLNRKISGAVFDMGNMSTAPEIPEGSAILTIHAFEQLGKEFGQILDFILASKPSIVIQYEPVLDFYDPGHEMDEPALRYCRKRHYLEGYLGALKELEAAGKIKILDAFRPELGGVLHEQSILVWQPEST